MTYFTDPIIRGPIFGCMLMSMAASLVGVLVFTRKRSLIGEALSHAAFPGVILALLIAVVLFSADEESLLTLVPIGAFVSAFLGLGAVVLLEKFKVASDASLCFVLSAFYGIGITLASNVQISHPQEYKLMLSYLFGQAATMTDVHILIYGILAILTCLIVALFFKELKVISFDSAFAKGIGMPTKALDLLTYALTVLAVIIGMRSVGVVLISAMLVAPAVASRQFTSKLKTMFYLAAFFGLTSGGLGIILSLELSDDNFILPSGPMIVVVASIFALLALLFAPKRGVVIRYIRSHIFRLQCMQENILKAIWRLEDQDKIPIELIKESCSSLYLKFVLVFMSRKGWIKKRSGGFLRLTALGKKRGASIVRLHRLWEVYLATYLGVGIEKVHASAEEMEHILTPELEKELTQLLQNPTLDPHSQPIPGKAK